MKQIISRMIQICLIVLAIWWVIKPVIKVYDENQKPKKEIIDLKLSEQEREVLQADILVCYRRHIFDTKRLLKKGGVLASKNYFETLSYTDSLLVSNEVQYLLKYELLLYFKINRIKDGLVNSFYDEVRVKNITRDESKEARILVYGKPVRSESITLSSFYGLFMKLLNSYLFLGLLIFIGSINRVLRNSDNDALFDPRDKLKFLLHLFIWPIRLCLWIRGNIIVHQYGTKLRVLNEQEKELVANFVNGVKGYTDLHSYFERRGLVTRRSFLMATLFFILAVIPIGFTSAPSLVSNPVNVTVVEMKEDPPPDFIQYKLEHNFVKAYLYEKPLLINNIFQVVLRQATSRFMCLIYPQMLSKDPTWRPPENLKLLS